VNSTDFPALDNLIGAAAPGGQTHSYGNPRGTGPGGGKFRLPDFRQRIPLGQARAGDASSPVERTGGTGAHLGDRGGNIDHIHTIGHTHNLPTSVAAIAGDFVVPHPANFGSFRGTVNGDYARIVRDTIDINTRPILEASGGADVYNVGTDGPSSGNSGNNNPPYEVVNYIVKAA
jgi:microcystin-dependent protein